MTKRDNTPRFEQAKRDYERLRKAIEPYVKKQVISEYPKRRIWTDIHKYRDDH